ncbi:hypothetical protein H6P81_010564 [Aristolochia fimbriata]|uniref:Uncharacterized protein n=1 Tax=Aristolochia fimbriata TaxID=158543 RepID=A0AAV7EPT7_ARIFI|nr:hypothetical protein H6P81_010564 [Aristolochia fimbriata]
MQLPQQQLFQQFISVVLINGSQTETERGSCNKLNNRDRCSEGSVLDSLKHESGRKQREKDVAGANGRQRGLWAFLAAALPTLAEAEAEAAAEAETWASLHHIGCRS